MPQAGDERDVRLRYGRRSSLVPRDRHGAALLGDGSVLVIGGESQAWGHKDRPFASCERWIEPADR